MLRILSKERLMTLEWEDFDKLMKSCQSVFSEWEE